VLSEGLSGTVAVAAAYLGVLDAIFSRLIDLLI